MPSARSTSATTRCAAGDRRGRSGAYASNSMSAPWAYGTRQELRDAGAHVLVSEPADLLGVDFAASRYSLLSLRVAREGPKIPAKNRSRPRPASIGRAT